MAQSSTLLSLPPELRLKVYAHTCPCFQSSDAYNNPVLTRRLSRPPKFHCYKCPGEAFLQVSQQTRAEIAPIFFGAHEYRFQIWMEHFPALNTWFSALSEDAAHHIRRFKLHTQVADESVDLARYPGTGSAMPGYIAVDLDASSEVEMVVSSKNWAQEILEGRRRSILDLAKGLPREEGKLRLTKEALLRMIAVLGWFGDRNDRERQMIVQQAEAKRLSTAVPGVSMRLG